MSDKLALGHHASKDIPGSVNVFAYWDSGHFLEKLKEQSVSLLATLTRPTPITIGSGLANIGYKSISHFLEKRKYAEICGKHLLPELDKYLFEYHPYVEKVNLIGHSLGGRVLVSALLEQVTTLKRRSAQHEAPLEVHNVLLMAAAAEVSDRDSAVLVNAVAGNIYHAYSTSDSVLLLNPLEKSIGRREVKYFKSTHMVKPDGVGFGHMDYWPNLNHVLVETKLFSNWIPSPPVEQIKIPELKGFTREDIELVDLLARSPWRVLKVACAVTGVAYPRDAPSEAAIKIVSRIKETGGNFAANKYRGHGVSYAETLEDTWKILAGETEKNIASLELLESEICTLIENIALRGLTTGANMTEITLSGIIKRAITISKHLNTPTNIIFIKDQPIFHTKQNIAKSIYIKSRSIPNNLWHINHFKLLPVIYLIHYLRGQIKKASNRPR